MGRRRGGLGTTGEKNKLMRLRTGVALDYWMGNETDAIRTWLNEGNGMG